MELVADRIASDPGTLGLLGVVEREIAEMMDLAACRYSLTQPPVPVMHADGSIGSSTHALVDGEFALPPEGVGVRVENAGLTLGWLHLVPDDRVGVPRETRKVAIALGQQLGTALARPRVPAPRTDQRRIRPRAARSSSRAACRASSGSVRRDADPHGRAPRVAGVKSRSTRARSASRPWRVRDRVVERVREQRRPDPTSRAPRVPPALARRARRAGRRLRRAPAPAQRDPHVERLAGARARRARRRRARWPARPVRSPRSCRWPPSTSSSPTPTAPSRSPAGTTSRRRCSCSWWVSSSASSWYGRATVTSSRSRAAPRSCGCVASPSSRRGASRAVASSASCRVRSSRCCRCGSATSSPGPRPRIFPS